MSAFVGNLISSWGGGTLLTIASKISLIPTPVFAEQFIALNVSSPIISSISCFIFSTSAPGKSTLFKTGIISRLFSKAR